MSVITLASKLSALTEIASKESTRYALTGVHVRQRTTGDVTVNRACATDSKMLAMVEWIDPYEYCNASIIPPDAPNGATSALIPRDSFKAILKTPPRCRLDSVGVLLSDTVSTFAARDHVETVANVEGRFPPVDEIMPTNKPTATVKLDPKRLAAICKAALPFASEDGCGNPMVTLDIIPGYNAKSAPMLRVTSVDSEGHKFTALLMTMS